MSAPARVPVPLRTTVDGGTFRSWRRAGPTWPAADQEDWVPPDPAVAMPPFVAASLAVHAGAESTVTLAVRGDAVRVRLRLSTHGAMAAVIVLTRWSGPSAAESGAEWVHVALLPARAAAEEVVGWIPGTDLGPVPDGATLRLEVTRRVVGGAGSPAGSTPPPGRVSPVVRWIASGGRWTEVGGGPPADADRVRAEVARLLRAEPRSARAS